MKKIKNEKKGKTVRTERSLLRLFPAFPYRIHLSFKIKIYSSHVSLFSLQQKQIHFPYTSMQD